MTTHHVIIGTGPAATNALETIRQLESEPSRITLIGDEPAHSRMALPYWLADQIPCRQTYTADQAYYQRLEVEARIGPRVEQIHPDARTLTLTDGTAIDFDTLLIATGSAPATPPIEGHDLPGVGPLWSLADVQSALDTATDVARPRVVLVGAGFVGMIVLSAMFKRGWQLTVVEQQDQVLPGMLDRQSAEMVRQWLSQRDVAVHAAATVETIQEKDSLKSVQLSNGTRLDANLVILATGVRPNLDLVRGTAIATDVGILVNDQMQTNVPGIYAAGDVAQGPVLLSDRPAIHAIQPTAVDHGRVAGANMAGQTVHYPGSLSMNVLNVCDLQCASYGNLGDSDTESVVIADPRRSVYRKLLWQGEQLVGGILCGQANDVGMLSDMGMIKGILQTRKAMGVWKKYLQENPFDIRRAYIALDVAGTLASTTLLGRPSTARGYRFDGAVPAATRSPHHALFFKTRDEQ